LAPGCKIDREKYFNFSRSYKGLQVSQDPFAGPQRHQAPSGHRGCLRNSRAGTSAIK
jgi:hypothetical protein